MPEGLLARLIPQGREWSYDDRTLIHQRGDPTTSCSVVLSGEVRLTNVDADGDKPLTSALLGRGQLYGVYQLMSSSPRSHTAYAVGKTSVLLLHGSEYRKLLDEDREFRDFVIAFHGYRLVRTMAMLEEERRGLPLSIRVARHLIARTRRDGETLTITQSDLAEEIGATRFAVGRELGKLELHQLIGLQYGKIVIRERGRLKQWINEQPGLRRLTLDAP